MPYTKSEIQKLRNDPLPQSLVNTFLYAVSSIAFVRAESNHMPVKKILTEALLINEVRYLNAYEGKDYSRKDILLALYTEENDDLCKQIKLFKRCAEYAENIRSAYKILPATDFLKINDALTDNDVDTLGRQIDAASSALIDDAWQILNDFYSPESEIPVLLRLALVWAELEDGFFDTKIHPFAKELFLSFAIRNSFEINHYSLFIMKQLITQRLNKEDIESFSSGFFRIIADVANEKFELLLDLTFCADKIKNELNSRLPKLCSDNVLRMLNNQLLLNNATAEEMLGVSTKTAISYLKQLEEIGLLKSERIGRELYYLNSLFMDSIDKGV